MRERGSLGPSLSQVQRIGAVQTQTQGMVMTAQVRQGLDMLQMNVQQLEQLVELQLTENPVLELEDYEGEPAEEFEEPETELPQPSETEGIAEYEELDTEWENRFDTSEYGPALYSPQNALPDPDDEMDIFELIPKKTTLFEILNDQLHNQIVPADVQKAAEAVIGLLDKRGFFTESVEDLALREGVSVDVANQALALVRTFDPAGIASSGLRECLLVQLNRLEVEYPFARAILETPDLFDKFLHNRRAELQKALDCSPGAMEYTCDLIASFNPYPSSGTVHEPVAFIAPDVVVRKNGQEWDVRLMPGRYSRLRINPAYRRLVTEKALHGEDAKFVKENLDKASDVMSNLMRRNSTLFLVARAIVDRQKDFLDQGAVALKPMRMADIAEELGFHESTIARTVSGKYMDTPQGVLEMKSFFSRAIGSELNGSGGASGVAILRVLQGIVDGEDPAKPYQDSELVELLRSKGYTVARRTIAKYRDKLHIPSTKLRKRKG